MFLQLYFNMGAILTKYVFLFLTIVFASKRYLWTSKFSMFQFTFNVKKTIVEILDKTQNKINKVTSLILIY